MEELNKGSINNFVKERFAWDPQRVILLNNGIASIFILTYHIILFAGMILESA